MQCKKPQTHKPKYENYQAMANGGDFLYKCNVCSPWTTAVSTRQRFMFKCM